MDITGTIAILSSPSALRPHIEWALGAEFGMPIALHWQPQPALPGTFHADHEYRLDHSIAARTASRLARWGQIRFEITEDPSPGSDGHRYSFTPSLGLFGAATGVGGDIMVHENRLHALLASGDDVRDGLQRLLGTAWDEELDIFRAAEAEPSLRWLGARSVG